MGKSSALKAATKEAESELDVTSIMLAREQVMDVWMDELTRMMDVQQVWKLHRMKHYYSSFPGEE